MPAGGRVTRNVVRVMALSRKQLLSTISTLAAPLIGSLAISTSLVLSTRNVHAQSNSASDQSGSTDSAVLNFGQYYTDLNPQTATGLTIVAGLAFVVLGVGAMMFHYRARANRNDSTRHAELTNLRAALDHAESLIAAQNAVLITWDNQRLKRCRTTVR